MTRFFSRIMKKKPKLIPISLAQAEALERISNETGVPKVGIVRASLTHLISMKKENMPVLLSDGLDGQRAGARVFVSLPKDMVDEAKRAIHGRSFSWIVRVAMVNYIPTISK